METLLRPFLLVLISLVGGLAQEDLEGKAFIFPTASSSAHVVLKPTLQQPLTAFTVCLRFYTDLTRAFSLFSYATKTTDNEILIFRPKPTEYHVNVGGAAVTFFVPNRQSAGFQEEQLCVSWESATGLVEFWFDGQPLPRKGLKRGYSISPVASIILGQEQDSFGGSFDVNQSLVGEIRDVCVWDRVLTAYEITTIWNGGTISNNPLINWRSLPYEIKGYVVIKPHLAQPV